MGADLHDPVVRTAAGSSHLAGVPEPLRAPLVDDARLPGAFPDGSSSARLTPAVVQQLGRAMGNRALSRLLAGPTAQRAAPPVDEGAPAPGATFDAARRPLSPGEVEAAIRYTKRRFDVRSQLSIQQIVGAHPDGDFGPETAQAVADFQAATGAEPFDGMVGELTLDAALRDRPITLDDAANGPDPMQAEQVRAFRSARFVHLVAELFDLPIESEALSVRLVEALDATQSTRHEAGGLPVISLGLAAFVDTATLRGAIQAGLTPPTPDGIAPGERPTFLSTAEEADAIEYNRDRLGERRAARIVQGSVGAIPDGIWGPDSVERVARLQASNGLDEVDGKVGLATLEVIHGRLRQAGDFDAIVRLIAQFFALDAAGLLDIGPDNDLPMNTSGGVGEAITLGRTDVRSASIIRLRSDTLTTVAGAATRIAHELVHARQQFAGDQRRGADLEFDAHSEEILAPTLRDPRIQPPERVFGKAKEIVDRLFWDMFPDARLAAWPRFQEVRAVARARFDALPSSERKPLFVDTMRALDAVTDPLERPESQGL